MPYRKKLIETALPLEAINREAAREKSIRHGHPSTLHLWWARRPLAACRAVLFASLVDDPASRPDEFPTEEAQAKERQRLFSLMEKLVKWENANDEEVLAEARAEILKSTGGSPPAVYDPFCGGGSIPLEAQRLGLAAFASDLNPVAVLITKALIEIPPRFAGQPPVNPAARQENFREDGWKGAAGLAADVRYYGKWMRDEAEKRIGHLYPKAALPPEYGGGEATVIAWLWARTVKCPNPACGCQMPLIRSFCLSTRKGKEAWLEPVVNNEDRKIQFKVRIGKGVPPEAPKVGRGAKFRCLVCRQIAADEHIKHEGMAKRLSSMLMAVVAEGPAGRLYLPAEHVAVVDMPPELVPQNIPSESLAFDPRNIWCSQYGMATFADLFTPRQLAALATFSDLVAEAREKVRQDALAAGLPQGEALHAGGTGAAAYADAVATYLGLAVSRQTDYSSSICSWHSGRETVRNTFSRQAIPMTWDFAEVNPFSSSTGNFLGAVEWIEDVLKNIACGAAGYAVQADAAAEDRLASSCLISTDPPYYDNIGYADLSDFFYVWLRRSLGAIYPELFATMLVPKAGELVATPYRFDGDAEAARRFFETGLGRVFSRMRELADPAYPITVYYAFKQTETSIDAEDDAPAEAGVSGAARVSTGWETMLEGLMKAGFSIVGTWPMRSEMSNRTVASGTNALASSIVLVCRPRPKDAPPATRKEFLAALRRELPGALKKLQEGGLAAVDLAQAAIGPGMAVYSRYAKVLEADGRAMPVRTALQLINQFLIDPVPELDPATRFAVAWYEQNGLKEGPFGEADVLARAKNTAVARLEEEGMLAAAKGKVRLLARAELKSGWQPVLGAPVWLCVQHLTKALQSGGEQAAASLAAAMGGWLAEAAKGLAYWLYTAAERNGWTEEALAYNALTASWPAIQEKAAALAAAPKEQGKLF